LSIANFSKGLVVFNDATRRVEEKRRHAAALQNASVERAGEFEFGYTKQSRS
jgi:hypothetical protein